MVLRRTGVALDVSDSVLCPSFSQRENCLHGVTAILSTVSTSTMHSFKSLHGNDCVLNCTRFSFPWSGFELSDGSRNNYTERVAVNLGCCVSIDRVFLLYPWITSGTRCGSGLNIPTNHRRGTIRVHIGDRNPLRENNKSTTDKICTEPMGGVAKNVKYKQKKGHGLSSIYTIVIYGCVCDDSNNTAKLNNK